MLAVHPAHTTPPLSAMPPGRLWEQFERNIDTLPLATFPAARYGPTNGPPSPTGSAPAGCTSSVDVSASARGMLIRPLPVCSAVPAGSALRAIRPTTMPFVRAGSTAFINAASPATCAAAAEVPLMTIKFPLMSIVWMSTPGAPMKTACPSC